MKTEEEIRNMSEDEFWEYINRPKTHPINEGMKPLDIKTKEDFFRCFPDAISIEEFDRIIREKYGM